ncbi:MAG: hypothetical protein ACKVU4_06585 [Phycisphaerales bacterium]
MNGLPQVEWEALHAQLQTLDPAVWNSAVRAWLIELTRALGSPYTLTDTQNIAIVSAFDRNEADDTARFVRRSLAQIRVALGPLCGDDDEYVRVVLLFADSDRMYDYACHYFPEVGRWGSAGGMLIRSGYFHIVLTGSVRHALRAMLAHELTHLMLSDRSLPVWLEEGFTQAMEEWITGASSFHVDREIVERHQECWRRHGLQGYWEGEEFGASDERQELAYHLSQMIVRTGLADRPKAFLEFAREATWEDCGAAAAKAHLGESLGHLAARCLGPGDWEPPPRTNELSASQDG